MDWKTVFELDTRSLAIFRMGLGICLLHDIVRRLPDVEAHLSSVGVYPVERLVLLPGQWSFHTWTGDTTTLTGLLLVAAAIAVLLMLGLFTRAATVLSFVFLTSLHYRFPGILNSGDDLLRILLLWGSFLPLGAAWSLDARRSSERPPRSVLHPAGVALMLQVCLVYWFVVLHRTGSPQWHRLGNALDLSLHAHTYATPLGTWFRDHLVWTHRPLTWAAMVVEALGPLLVFSPWKNAHFRVAGVALFVTLHVSFALLLPVGMFWMVSCTSWLIFLPGALFDALGRRVGALELGLGPRSEAWHPFVGSVVILLCAAHVLLNVSFLFDRQDQIRPPERAAQVIRAVGLWKKWSVYTPPPKEDSWPVLVGERSDGSEVDLFYRTETVDWDRPEPGSWVFRSQRWRRILFGLRGNRRVYVPLSDYLAMRWEREHPGERIEKVRLHLMVRPHHIGADNEVVRVDVAEVQILH